MQLFRWFVDLQRQRNRLQDEMTEHFVGNSENARECFGKAAKAMRALPLAKLRVGHILVDRTLLKFLLLELQKAGEHIFDFEIPLLSPVIFLCSTLKHEARWTTPCGLGGEYESEYTTRLVASAFSARERKN